MNVNSDENEVFYYFTQVTEVEPMLQLNSKISASANEKFLKININCCMKAKTKPLHLVLCVWWDLCLKILLHSKTGGGWECQAMKSERKEHFELFAFQQGSILKPVQNVIKPKMWELEPPEMVFQ